MKFAKEIMAGFPEFKSIMLGDGQIDYILGNLESVLNVPGAVLELGCNKGVTTSFMRRLLDLAESDKEIHVYESFQGLPEKTDGDGNTHCKAGDSTCSQVEFINTFVNSGLKVPVINKGWFGEIPDSKYPDNVCFAFFDGDFYGSIMDSFRKVYHKMSHGGIILVHDYDWAPFPGVKKACDDFLIDKPEKMVNEIFGIGKLIKE